MKLLLVEDSTHLRESLARGFRKSGFAVDTASDGETGLLRASSREYDAMILDLTLPRLDGMQVLQTLRERGSDLQILILTAREAIEDRVRGLRAGADDYLVKPFAFEELLARVDGLVRRRYERKTSQLHAGHGLVIDTGTRKVTREGQEIRLTAREYAVLEYLTHRAGEIVTRLELDEHIYEDRKHVLSNAIDSAVCILRRKLADAGCPDLIETRRGQGYVLEVAGEPR